jgi:hypothetical protein
VFAKLALHYQTLQFTSQRDRQPHAGCRQGMADGNRAAIDLRIQVPLVTLPPTKLLAKRRDRLDAVLSSNFRS